MPNLKRDIKKLDRKTGRKTTIKSGVPHSRDGQDGDITLRKTPNGHELFAKMDGLWYGTRLERIQGTVKRALHGRVAFDTGKKEDKPPKPPKKDLDNIINNPNKRNSFTKGRRTINDIVSNIVTKNRKTNDVILKNSKTSTASPNLKLFNDSSGGTGVPYVPTLQFIKSPASGLTAMANNDSLGVITFLGDDSSTTNGSIIYGMIRCTVDNVSSGAKDSRFQFTTYDNNNSIIGMELIGKDLSINGSVTATTGFTTTGTWTFDEYTSGTIGITSVQDSGTTFNDNDTSLMTAAAIANKIESSGVTSLVATANETTVSGATGAVTIGLPDDVTIGGDLTVTGDVAVNGNNINFDADSHSTIAAGAVSGTNTSGYRVSIDGGQSTGIGTGGSVYLRTSPLGSSGSSANTIITILGVNGTTAEGNVGIKSGSQLFFDSAGGLGNTYIEESSADILDIYVGGDKALSLNENTSYAALNTDWSFRAASLEIGNSTNKWADGYHGNSTKIALLPNDFFLSNASGSRVASVGLYSDDDGGSGKIKDASTNVYAMKIIPKGFTATHVRVNCSSVIASAVTPHDGNIANDTINSHTAGATNGDIAFSGTDPVGDGNTYVVVEFDPSGTGNQIYGGTITIARTT